MIITTGWNLFKKNKHGIASPMTMCVPGVARSKDEQFHPVPGAL